MGNDGSRRRALVLGTLACVTWSTVFVVGRLAIREREADPMVLGQPS